MCAVQLGYTLHEQEMVNEELVTCVVVVLEVDFSLMLLLALVLVDVQLALFPSPS